MKILGLSFDYHDAAAALIIDGNIFAAAEEERFSRKKHDINIPNKSIDFCLARAGIGASELDKVVFYEDTLLKYVSRLSFIFLRASTSSLDLPAYVFLYDKKS